MLTVGEINASCDIWLFGRGLKMFLGRASVVAGAEEVVHFWALPPSFTQHPAPAAGKFLTW